MGGHYWGGRWPCTYDTYVPGCDSGPPYNGQGCGHPYPGDCYPTTDRMLQFMWQYRLDAPGMCPGGGCPPPTPLHRGHRRRRRQTRRHRPGILASTSPAQPPANRLRPLAGKATARPGGAFGDERQLNNNPRTSGMARSWTRAAGVYNVPGA